MTDSTNGGPDLFPNIDMSIEMKETYMYGIRVIIKETALKEKTDSDGTVRKVPTYWQEGRHFVCHPHAIVGLRKHLFWIDIP